MRGIYTDNIYIGSEPHKWTLGAIKCYQRGCRCEGCYIKKTYPQTLGYMCAMKHSVRFLIKKFGLPDNITLQQVLEQEDE